MYSIYYTCGKGHRHALQDAILTMAASALLHDDVTSRETRKRFQREHEAQEVARNMHSNSKITDIKVVYDPDPWEWTLITDEAPSDGQDVLCSDGGNAIFQVVYKRESESWIYNNYSKGETGNRSARLSASALPFWCVYKLPVTKTETSKVPKHKH
jgi:hypothetical protein